MPSLKEASEFFRQKEYGKAISILDELLAKEPENTDLIYNKSLCLYYLDQKEEAAKTLKNIKKFKTKQQYMNSMKLLHECGPAEDVLSEEGLIKTLRFFKPKETFKDVIGMEKEKKYLYQNILIPLRKPELYKAYNRRISATCMFYGAPGIGKTWIAKALGGESGANMIILRMQQLFNMYVGNGEKNLHTIFEQARKNTPCIMFIDEMDAISTSRSSMSDSKGTGSELANMITVFLTELDGIESNPEGLFIIGATNRPWDIDPAIKRSGRFSDVMYVRPPNFKERAQMIKFYMDKTRHSSLNYQILSLATMGYTSSDIKLICEKAILKPIIEADAKGLQGKEAAEQYAARRPVNMQDIISVIKKEMPSSSLDEWYIRTRKELLGTIETRMEGGKTIRTWKSGSLEPQEKRMYWDMLKDVINSTNNASLRMKLMARKAAVNLVF